jgi:polysaccharide export outer membrane protein
MDRTLMIRLASLTVPVLFAAWAQPAVAGQAFSTSAVTTCPEGQADDSSYRLQVGDVLDIQFRFTPEFSASPTVRPDGRIAMSGVGDVTAKGLTATQLTCALARAYDAVLRDPIISVSVRNFENPYFIVSGEVERPGKYDLRSETTLTQAVAIAGGFKRSAKQQVYLFRRTDANGGIEPRVLDVKAMLEKGQVAEDLVLLRDDMVYVPQSGFSKWERFIPVLTLGFYIPIW